MFHKYKIAEYIVFSFQLVLGIMILNVEPLSAQEFQIQLDRPDNLPSGTQVSYRAIRVGKSFSPSQSGNVPQTYKDGSKIKYEIALQGRVQTEQSSDSSQLSIKITQFHANDELIDEGLKLELKNQTLQIQEKNGQKTFEANGTLIEGFDLEMLELLFSVDAWGKVGTDKAFGSAHSQTVGNTWTFQPSVASLREILPLDTTDEEEIGSKFECTGKAKLFGQTTIAGRECLQFRFSERCPDCLSGKTPDGLEVVGGFVERTITGTLPVDPRFPWQKVNIKKGWSITRKITKPPLNGIIIQTSLIDEVTREITYP